MSFRFRKRRSWLDDRTTLEKVLLSCIFATLVLVTVLIVYIFSKALNADAASGETRYSCVTPTCLREASKIIKAIDQKQNPCENFYKFSCGKLLKNAHGDETVGPFFLLQKKASWQLKDLYERSSGPDEHAIVIHARHLYLSCLNSTFIDLHLADLFKFLQEEADWKNRNFSWLDVSRKYRQMGYFHEAFLNVTVEPDPEENTKYIFKVSLPFVQIDRNTLKTMVKTFVKFGGSTHEDVYRIYDFAFQLQRIVVSGKNQQSLQRITVEEYQANTSFRWIQLLNDFIGPKVNVKNTDYVLFPAKKLAQTWFKLIDKTPEKTLSDFMVWKAFEDILAAFQPDSADRQHVCSNVVASKYDPNPIQLLYLNKYLPHKKFKRIKQILTEIKFQVIAILHEINTDRIERPLEKLVAMERIRTMEEIIGAPDDYYEKRDKGFDDLYFDMVEIKSLNFFELLRQANRNYHSRRYYRVRDTSQIGRKKWNVIYQSSIPSIVGSYYHNENLIVLPASLFQDEIFDETGPEYRNYASIGVLLGYHLYAAFEGFKDGFEFLWKEESQQTSVNHRKISLFASQVECFPGRSNSEEQTVVTDRVFAIYFNLAVEAAFRSYEISERRIVEKIGPVPFSKSQLFWIAAASYFCQPTGEFGAFWRTDEERGLFAQLVSSMTTNSYNFNKEFLCSSTVKRNAKCILF